MGRVVHLDRAPADGDRRSGRRPRRSKTALVLGGGGLTGGVYEIGALRALDLLSTNRTVNEFDVYVGTSAGAFIAALAANGVTPEEMMRVVNGQSPSPFRDIDLGQLLRPNLSGFGRSAALLPGRAAKLLREVAPHVRHLSIMDIALVLAQGLPTGMYSGAGIEDYLRTVLGDPDRTDDFRALDRELYLAATDLDTCERIVFGSEGWDDVPISTAVRASAALPVLYKPVRLRDRELIDGAVISTTNLDIAVEAGARFILVVNPLVPYVNGEDRARRRVSDLGMPQIGYQAFKVMAHQRLREMAKHWEERYPGVDIVLVEPEPDDELMFQTSVMSYASRVDVARHGFQSVTMKLAEDYDRYEAIAHRHGIEISPERVRAVVGRVAEGDEESRTGGWRRILEQTTGTLLRQTGASGG